MPFLVLRWGTAGVNALLASEKMTFPTGLRSVVAISLAALKTSSSMTRGVPIGKTSPNKLAPDIVHQMRDARAPNGRKRVRKAPAMVTKRTSTFDHCQIP